MINMGCILLENEWKKKVVGDGGTSGRIYVPKSWKNKKVIVIKIDD